MRAIAIQLVEEDDGSVTIRVPRGVLHLANDTPEAPRTRRGSPPPPDELRAKARALYESSDPVYRLTDIGELVGRTDQTILNWARAGRWTRPASVKRRRRHLAVMPGPPAPVVRPAARGDESLDGIPRRCTACGQRTTSDPCGHCHEAARAGR